MFGLFGDSAIKTKKSPEDRRFEVEMARYEAQDKLFDMAIDCQYCRDLGLIAVIVRHIEFPDDLSVEYMACECGQEIHPKIRHMKT